MRKDRPWKVDLHLHCAEDLQDAVQFSAEELLFRARDLGFSAVAFTLHDCFFSRPELHSLAKDLGVLLIPGVELRVEGADVVVLNLSEAEAVRISSFDDLHTLRRVRGGEIFVLAPHPFYRFGGSMGQEVLLENLALFDAIEQCHFHTRLLDPNRSAQQVAREHGKPMLATSDAHRLSGFGRHFTLVDHDPGQGLTAVALFNAIRTGLGRPVSPPVSLWQFVGYALWALMVHDVRVRLERA